MLLVDFMILTFEVGPDRKRDSNVKINPLVSIIGYASILAILGQVAEAEPLYAQALQLRTEVLGTQHPDTNIARQRLAHNRLLQPSRSADALEPARDAAIYVRAKRDTFGSTPRDDAQRSREAVAQRSYFTTLADADWSAVTRSGNSGKKGDTLPRLRLEAFGALQDAMAGSTSQAVAQMAAGQAAEGAGEGGAAEPGLVFTPPEVGTDLDDGLLAASEVTTLKLNADWLILSACNTAAGDGGGEPGLSGLARAFFYAGARSLLASHWPVRDDVAAEITVDAIRRENASGGKISRAEALQAAMRQIRMSPGDPSRAHPSAWAPFSLVGDNSARAR